MPATVADKRKTEPGRGLQKCPGCNLYIGVMSKACPCGHVFKPDGGKVAASARKVVNNVPPPAQKVVEKPTPPVKQPDPLPPVGRSFYDPSVMRVWVPAGECPVKLKGTTIEEVAEWADAVRAVFSERRNFLTLNGLVYFARTIYDFQSAEFALVKGHLHQLFGGEK